MKRIGILILLICFLYNSNAQDSSRCLALVVANSNYYAPQDRLNNPVNDGIAVAGRLEELGFNVIRAFDKNYEGFLSAIQMFGSLSKHYDVAVFYYCGHGAQGKYPNSVYDNFMIPVNVTVVGNDDVVNKCISLTKVADVLNEEPTQCQTKILFVDACRNIPTFKSRNRSFMNEKGGLTTIGYDDCWTFYSTTTGDVADDGLSTHSPFAKAWLEAMRIPNLSLGGLIHEIAKRVKQTTNNEQQASSVCNSPSDWVFLPEKSISNQHAEISMNKPASPKESVEKDTNVANKAESIYKEGLRLYVKEKYKEAVDCFVKAANFGCVDAWATLGFCYYYGRGVDQSYKDAVIWYKKAAAQGVDYAQTGLGMCYLKGNGVPQNYQDAANWFTLAAENGDDFAQYFIGVCYSLGRGVEANYQKAFMWFRKAAAQGNADAQDALGDCYYYGMGVEENRETAVAWYTKASSQGNISAQDKLKNLK